MGKKPFTSKSRKESVVDLITSSEDSVPLPSPSAASELSIFVGTQNVGVSNVERSVGGRKKDSPV
ncbi:hypothetical protein RvY_11171 [Ramazzottius varieornatus]|uniref:Uncharacterized protein n=1 Tax=Ramazzottius varieornatus TaxID=947166 RepID=A0A1D1VJM5_RAMVA|nr:hypothetical protein RvY_11171 [Ramazzottius varieornatus]